MKSQSRNCLTCVFAFSYNTYPLASFSGRKCQLHQQILVSPADFPPSHKSLWNRCVILEDKARHCSDFEIAPENAKIKLYKENSK